VLGLRQRKVSLGAVIWIVVGLIVASGHGFLQHLHTLSGVLSAALAVALWPLVVLRIHVSI
jgi:ABC-type anion transport system duplicated permease subunit